MKAQLSLYIICSSSHLVLLHFTFCTLNDFRETNLNYYADIIQCIWNLPLMTCFHPIYLHFNIKLGVYHNPFSKWSFKYIAIVNLRNVACRIVQFCSLLIPNVSPMASTLFQMPAEIQWTLSAKPEADADISPQLHKIDLICMPFISSVLFIWHLPVFPFTALC